MAVLHGNLSVFFYETCNQCTPRYQYPEDITKYPGWILKKTDDRHHQDKIKRMFTMGQVLSLTENDLKALPFAIRIKAGDESIP